MFDNQNLGPEILANPGMLQSLILQELQNRLGGAYSIADPNNAFCFVLEAGSSIVAQTVRLNEKQFETLYPVRATSMEELYPNLSDFDYINLTASPAPVKFRLILDAAWLAQNAVTVSPNYGLVVIPATSVIVLGGRNFSLYYPINILINQTTGTILATWDLTTANPLFTQSSNFLDDVTEFTTGGLNLLSLIFTAYQFSATTYTDIAIPNTGFNKNYTYTDKFYAARVYSLINNAWTELKYTLSQAIYDPITPTAILTILSDTNNLQVQIPQVYFTQGQVGQQIKVVIYTTQGALNTTIAQTDSQSVTANFDTASSPYAAILSQPPTLLLTPYNQTQLIGGSDGMTFNQLRTEVINASLYNQVPVTPLELNAAASKLGFTLTKYLDNITDRIYFASSLLTNTQNSITIPIGMLPTQFNLQTLSTTSTILTFSDNVTTVLPTTIFSYNTVTNICLPLTNAQVQNIASMSTETLLSTLNTTTYTRQPYHIALYNGETYPAACTFDLTAPMVTNLSFVTENAASPLQLTVASVAVTHLQAGTGGFQITIGTKRSASLANADPSSFYVVLCIEDSNGTIMQLRATYQTSTTLLDVYTVLLSTDYHLSQDNLIRTTMNTSASNIATLVEIPLISKVSFYLGVSAANNTIAESASLQPEVPTAYSDMLAVSKQSATLMLGANLSSSVYNIVTSTWGAQPYATYPENIYHTYPNDIYATNPDGTLQTEIVSQPGGGNSVNLTILHTAGSPVLDSSGNPVIKYAAGSIQLDAFNNPIPLTNRSVIFTVEMLQLDARLYSSTNPTDIAYLSGFTTLFNGAVTALSSLQQNLLERTALYYKPMRTIGLGTYSISNGVTVKLPLGLSFALTIYVSASVLSDTVMLAQINVTILSTIIAEIAEPVISLTAIGTKLNNIFGTLVSSIDMGGINGNPTLQTVALIDTDAVPSIGLTLTKNNDGSLALLPSVSVVFKLTPGS